MALTPEPEVPVAGTTLVIPAINSPNFLTGISGWIIRIDGSVEFNNGVFRGTVTAGTFQGTNFVINQAGAFFYSATPALGNLIASIAPAAGVDQYGNTYPQGLQVSQGEIDAGIINGAVINAGSISAGSIGGSQIVNSTFQGGAVTESTITFDSSGGVLLVYASTTTTTTVNSSGNFTVPAGVTQLQVECWGGGAGGAGGGLAGGANSGGYGGGAGAYSKVNALTVTPLAVLPYVVGAGGAGGAVNALGIGGGTTTFNSTGCKALGGSAASSSSIGRGGAAGSGIGDIKFSGGNSAAATGSGATGGGSSAGPASNGNAAAANSGSGTGAGAPGVSGGGIGGAGGAQGVNGSVGTIPGGGSGGGGGGSNGLPGSAGTGANGRNGQVKITYQSGTSLIASIAPVAGSDGVNAYPAGLAGQIVAFNPASATAETWHPGGTAGSTLGTGWTNAISPQSGFNFRLNAHRNIEFAGALSNGTAAAGQTMITLPSVYRPPMVRTMLVACRTTSSTAFVQVNTDGTVVLVALPAGGHTFEFDGCFYNLDLA